MRVFGLTLTACAILALSACSGKSDSGKKGQPAGAKSNAEKIIGKWESVKSESGGPVGATVEFTKDGKMSITMKDPKGKELTMEGTYKVEGDKLTTTLKVGGMEKTDKGTIKTLTDSQLVIADEKGKTDEFKKK